MTRSAAGAGRRLVTMNAQAAAATRSTTIATAADHRAELAHRVEDAGRGAGLARGDVAHRDRRHRREDAAHPEPREHQRRHERLPARVRRREPEEEAGAGREEHQTDHEEVLAT